MQRLIFYQSTTTIFMFFPRPHLIYLCQIPLLSANQDNPKNAKTQSTIGAIGNSICIPKDYSEFDLPNETNLIVNVRIDIKDISEISDKEFSVTLNAFLLVRWKEGLLMIDQVKIENNLTPSDDEHACIPVDESFIKAFWLHDTQILNLKEVKFSVFSGNWRTRR